MRVLRASVVTLPCLTAATGGRFCWPSSSQGALQDGCWSSPSHRSYPGLCAAVREQRGQVVVRCFTWPGHTH